jgi:hypothetical protein
VLIARPLRLVLFVFFVFVFVLDVLFFLEAVALAFGPLQVHVLLSAYDVLATCWLLLLLLFLLLHLPSIPNLGGRWLLALGQQAEFFTTTTTTTVVVTGLSVIHLFLSFIFIFIFVIVFTIAFGHVEESLRWLVVVPIHRPGEFGREE